MKLPKTRKKYCPNCKKHTEHKLLESKKKTPFSAHPMSRANKDTRARLRGRLGYGNKGRFSKPPISKWRMAGRKSSKKTDLRYNCSACKKMHVQSSGIRTKKLELK